MNCAIVFSNYMAKSRFRLSHDFLMQTVNALHHLLVQIRKGLGNRDE